MHAHTLVGSAVSTLISLLQFVISSTSAANDMCALYYEDCVHVPKFYVRICFFRTVLSSLLYIPDASIVSFVATSQTSDDDNTEAATGTQVDVILATSNTVMVCDVM